MKIYPGCVIEPENGDESVELDVYNFKGPGVALAMYNVDEVCQFTSVPTFYEITAFLLLVLSFPPLQTIVTSVYSLICGIIHGNGIWEKMASLPEYEEHHPEEV